MCPADSKMGTGTATVAVAFGPETVEESVTVGLFAAPSSDGFVHLAIIAIGKEPITAKIVFPAVLRRGRLQITVPPIPSVPAAADVSLVALRVTLGGAITYFERVHGHNVPYRPRGVGLPSSCPRGGWRLAADLSFMDGTSSNARTAVRCPRRRR
jgi:hypothetical protein